MPHSRIVSLLLILKNKIINAFSNEDIRRVKELIETGADVNAEILTQCDTIDDGVNERQH